MRTETTRRIRTLSLEKIFSIICFIAGSAFLVIAILGLWRHFFTMGLCFAVGIMMSDDKPSSDITKKRHEAK